MKRFAAFVMTLTLAACAEPVSPEPGATVTGSKVNLNQGDELPAVYLGKVDFHELYTLCYEGDRLYFWSTMREGAMAVHVNDVTCKGTT